jgi:mannose/cellobiose epimerase-like protein (N-acyl-D-glucosamine 2-epimerase family)
MALDKALLVRLRTWMFDTALPLWISQGLDPIGGGPVESFALDGLTPSGVDLKRTRACARQIYVMSHAHLLGVPGARAAAQAYYEFFVARMWLGPERGWLRSVTRQATPLDLTPDLYDYAFALFALGWFHKAMGDATAIALAHQTLDVLEQHFRHPSKSGFHASLPPALPREQNPHMHLIEAALVLAETSNEARFLDLANEIAQLFKDKLCRQPEGVLPEFFDDEWNPIDGEKGRWIEPGHQFEWAWILAKHQKLTGNDNVAVVKALVGWAEKHGVDQTQQVTFNRVRDDGLPLDRGSRTWPNTERIKGWIGLAELTGIDPTPAVSGSAQLLLDRYLGPPARPGMWIDAFDAQGGPTAQAVPTSTFYHVFLAFAEALRFAGEAP